jgi:hypothetical protein
MIRALPEKLYQGSHEPDGEMCVMEAVAYTAGEAWTDNPACACPVLTRYCQAINDRMDDEFRQRLLPYVPRLIGTRSTPEVELRRAFRAADWAVRRFAVSALLSAGLEAEAKTLQELSPIVDERSAGDAAAGAAWEAAGVAWEAARAAAGEAAGAAAGAAWAAAGVAGVAAGDAAGEAAGAAGDAAAGAAWAAAGDAWEAAGVAAAAGAAWDAAGVAGDAAGAAGAAGDLALLCLDDLLSIVEAEG